MGSQIHDLRFTDFEAENEAASGEEVFGDVGEFKGSAVSVKLARVCRLEY